MTKSSMINTRLEPALKKSSEAVLSRLGVSTSEAITIFLNQVVLCKGFPFPVRLPNAQTRAALDETLARQNLEKHKDFGTYLKKRAKTAKE